MTQTELQEKDKVIEGLRASLQKVEKERDELKEKLRTVQLTLSPAQQEQLAELETLKAQNKDLSIQLRSSQLALLVAKDKVAKLQASAGPPATPNTDRDRESICSSPTGSVLGALANANTTSTGKFAEMEAELLEIRNNVVRHHNELIRIIANFHVEIKLPALVPLPEPAATTSHSSSFATPVKGSAHSAIPIDLSNGKVSDLQHSLTGNKARLAAMLEMGEKLKRPSSKANVLGDNFETLSRRSSLSRMDVNNQSFSVQHDDARATQFLAHVHELAQLVDSDSAVLERLRHVAEVVNKDIDTKNTNLKEAQTKLAEVESALVAAKASAGAGDKEQTVLLTQLQTEKDRLQKQLDEVTKHKDAHALEITRLTAAISEANVHITSKTDELTRLHSHVREIESHVQSTHVEFHSVYKSTTVTTTTTTVSSTEVSSSENITKRMSLLSSTMNGMKQHLDEQSKEITELKATIARLQIELAGSKDDVKKAKDDLKKGNAELNGKSEELLKTINELNTATSNLADLQQEVNALETKLREMEAGNSKSAALKKQQDDDKAAADKKIAHLTKMYTQLLDEKKSWNANAASSNDENQLALKKKSEELEHANELVDELKARLMTQGNDHTAETAELKEDLSAAKSTVDALTGQVAALEKKLSEQFKEHQKELLVYKKQLSELAAAQDSHDQEAHDRVLVVEEQLTKLAASHQAAIVDMEKSLAEAKELLDSTRKAAEESQKQFLTTKEALKKSDKKISDMANTVSEQKKQIESLTAQKGEAEKKVDQMKKMTQQLLEEKKKAPSPTALDERVEQLNSKNAENETLRSQLAAAEESVIALKEQITQLESLLTQAQKKAEEANNRTSAALEEQLAFLGNAKKEELRQRDKKITEQQKDLSSANAEKDALKQKVDQLQQQLKQLPTEPVVPASTLTELNAAKDSVTQLKAEVEVLQHQLSQLQTEKANVDGALREALNEVDKAKREAENQAKQVKLSESDKASITKANESQLNKVNEQIAALQKQEKGQLDALAAANQRIAELQEQIASMNAALQASTVATPSAPEPAAPVASEPSVVVSPPKKTRTMKKVAAVTEKVDNTNRVEVSQSSFEASAPVIAAPVTVDPVPVPQEPEFPAADLGFLSWEPTPVVEEQHAPIVAKLRELKASGAKKAPVKTVLPPPVYVPPVEISPIEWPSLSETKDVKVVTKHLEHYLEYDKANQHIVPLMDPSSVVHEKKTNRNAFRQSKTQKQLKAEKMASKTGAPTV